MDKLLPKPSKVAKVDHHKALPVGEVGAFMQRLRQTSGMGALALEFAILTAARSGEVRGATFLEIDRAAKVWIVPADRMKAGKEHRVPLSARSLEILAIAKAMDADSKYLFSINGKPLSNMAMPMALRRAGMDVTVHGFRSSFRDWVSEETGHPSDVAEMALAHKIASSVEASYRRGNLMARRRRLMDDWEKYCFTPYSDNVINFERIAA